MSRKFKNTVGIFFILVIGTVFFVTRKSGERRHSDFMKRGYQGTITEIKWPQYRRGCPDILVNGKWVQLTYDEQFLFKDITVGDSIVKRSGSDRVLIFRRDSSNNLTSKEFHE